MSCTASSSLVYSRAARSFNVARLNRATTPTTPVRTISSPKPPSNFRPTEARIINLLSPRGGVFLHEQARVGEQAVGVEHNHQIWGNPAHIHTIEPRWSTGG